MSSAAPIFTEDFDALRAGTSFVTPARTITESDLVSFSALTGDWHPQHADATWAAGSQFGERVAHGMLVLSYAVGLVPIDPDRVVALRGVDAVAFKRPVRIGDTIRVEGSLEETKPITDRLGLVTFIWRIVNQEDELAVRARVTVLWRRGEEAAATPNGRTEEVYL
ncbi:MAG: MaoC family dehydratase [Solirubrobacterales bacterium]